MSDAVARIRALSWFQDYDLCGVRTGGKYAVEPVLRWLRLPARLDGLRVLDVGANDGFYSFECERRGAAEVVSLDHPEWGYAGIGVDNSDPYRLAHELLGSRAIPVRARLESQASADFPGGDRPFNVVLFMGVLYHLLDPVGVLRRLAPLLAPGGLMVVETLVGALEVPYPAARFWRGRVREYNGDATTWWAPNPACVSALLAEAGLEVTAHLGTRGDRAVFHATREAR